MRWTYRVHLCCVSPISLDSLEICVFFGLSSSKEVGGFEFVVRALVVGNT